VSGWLFSDQIHSVKLCVSSALSVPLKNSTFVEVTRSGDLIELACSRLTRNLTRAEWQQYLGQEPYRATCPNLPVPPE
jgi:hypothetical protein